jgi:phosphopentomutase
MLAKLEGLDYRTGGKDEQGEEIVNFWDRWRSHYGETGLVNPRGDRLLTELTIRALKELRPKMIMVNYNDPDYVHWGNMTHYTRGIAVMDEGLRQLVATVEADAEYRDNTIFFIVPDCGRDSNPFAAVPCQHHFNTRSSHDIFALAFGPGIAKGQVVDHRVDQISVAATLGKWMKMETAHTEGPVLAEAFA